MKRLVMFRVALMLFAAIPLAQNSARAEETAKSARADETLLQRMVMTGNTTAWIAALKASGLLATVEAKGPLSVFAPTNDAFAALPPGTLQSLLLPEHRERLVAVVKLHLVAGNVTIADEPAERELKTLQGQSMRLNRQDQNATVGQATVLQRDLKCSNGTLHLIDRVLIPESLPAPEDS